MRIDILTLFPEMFSAVRESILGRAQKSGKIQINIVNIRDYTDHKHLKCDDYPFGGGAGMVMMPQPIGAAIEALDKEHKAHRIYLSPKGETLRQQKVFALLEYDHLILLCGHYEGVDQRAIDLFIDEEISIGDYVLTGGELPA
ncbi:MAG: tRNA (guanosine(37)-N1)-methyltransferase TrmD, partial [Clostridia bacterium]|nr:tRNA (guanosine(37)-N1)-methyltransferase TrmD [Clostridia bacterium]